MRTETVSPPFVSAAAAQPVDALAALLRGERPPQPSSETLLAAALRHGVASLLVHLDAASGLSPEVAAALKEAAHRQAAIWAVRQRELAGVLAGARGAGIDVLVVKGAHLAHTLYPDSAARECQDVDLYVRPFHHDAIGELLASLGYEGSATNTGDAALGQAIFHRPGVPGTTIDLHSRLLTAPSLAGGFAFEELWERSQPLPGFEDGGRAPCLADAFEIAVAHLAFHHPGDRRLVWLYDLWLLLGALSPADVERVGERLRGRRIPQRHDPIAAVQRHFPTAAGARMSALLHHDGEEREPRGEAPLGRLVQDLRALPSWRSRLRLLRGHLLPPRAYMRRTYAPGSRLPLPVLYLWRVVKGSRNWLFRSGS